MTQINDTKMLPSRKQIDETTDYENDLVLKPLLLTDLEFIRKTKELYDPPHDTFSTASSSSSSDSSGVLEKGDKQISHNEYSWYDKEYFTLETCDDIFAGELFETLNGTFVESLGDIVPFEIWKEYLAPFDSKVNFNEHNILLRNHFPGECMDRRMILSFISENNVKQLLSVDGEFDDAAYVRKLITTFPDKDPEPKVKWTEGVSGLKRKIGRKTNVRKLSQREKSVLYNMRPDLEPDDSCVLCGLTEYWNQLVVLRRMKRNWRKQIMKFGVTLKKMISRWSTEEKGMF